VDKLERLFTKKTQIKKIKVLFASKNYRKVKSLVIIFGAYNIAIPSDRFGLYDKTKRQTDFVALRILQGFVKLFCLSLKKSINTF